MKKQCKECLRVKNKSSFYESKGYKCVGCCWIEKYNYDHNPEDPSLTRSILTEKYENKIIELEQKLRLFKSRLDELQIN